MFLPIKWEDTLEIKTCPFCPISFLVLSGLTLFPDQNHIFRNRTGLDSTSNFFWLPWCLKRSSWNLLLVSVLNHFYLLDDVASFSWLSGDSEAITFHSNMCDLGWMRLKHLPPGFFFIPTPNSFSTSWPLGETGLCEQPSPFWWLPNSSFPGCSYFWKILHWQWKYTSVVALLSSAAWKAEVLEEMAMRKS